MYRFKRMKPPTSFEKYSWLASIKPNVYRRKRNAKKVLTSLDNRYNFYVYPYNYKMQYQSSKDVPFSYFSSDTLIAKRISDGKFVRIDVDVIHNRFTEHKLCERDERRITATFK